MEKDAGRHIKSSVRLRLGALALVVLLGLGAGGLVLVLRSNSGGMVVSDGQAWPVAEAGNPVKGSLKITNNTGLDDRLMDVASPNVSAGLFNVPLCAPLPSPGPGQECDPGEPFGFWPIAIGETIHIRGQLVVRGFSRPLTPGETVEVTLQFAHAAPVTVSLQVVSKPPAL